MVIDKLSLAELLRRGLAPVTDSEDALIELGFSRAYPQMRDGYDSTIWERSIEGPSSGGLRTLARQRAFLDKNGIGTS